MVTLRLDDASIVSIQDGVATRMNPTTAFALNILSEKDCIRLEKLIVTAGSMAPQIAVDPIPLMSGDAKRARKDDISATWTLKCKTMLKKIGRYLGVNKNIFWHPIDPKLLPDYYTVIENPMSFDTIKERLDTDKYELPIQFYNDVTLVFANCQKYNPVSDPFRKMGESADAMFKKMWKAKFSEGDEGCQPVSDTRKAEISELLQSEEMADHMEELLALITPELLIKVADGQFEIDFEILDDASLRKMDVFLCNIFARKKADAERRRQAEGDEGRQPVSDTRKAEISELLQSEEMGDHMEGIVALLPPELLEGVVDDEFELDLEVLDETTIRKLDVYLSIYTRQKKLKCVDV